MNEIEALLRVGVATLLGAALGLEREMTGKPAGLRTHMLVAEGAALFMVGSILLTEQFGVSPALNVRVDVTRVASTIVTGVGFLGAGMILRARDRVYGLTTAAGIWVAAAIGMLAGSGYYIVSIFGTILGLLTLVALRIVERRLGLLSSAYPVEDAEDE
ncbi:MAG: MgtC/SapB family protein [Sphaerobacter sp.]|nr:MgtC/SapB family protein [Sphaerobacter sp.]